MQNKGAIKFFAIAFALVCLFQLSFNFFTSSTERAARKFAGNEQALTLAKQMAKGDAVKEQYLNDSIFKFREKYYLDSMANQVVYNVLLRKYTYKECLERQINLGLDLKGGMNVTMEVSVVDVVRALSGYNTNPVFNQAMTRAVAMQKNSQQDFVTLFGQAFKEIAPDAQLAAIFSRIETRDKIKPNATNDEVLKVIRAEANDAYDRTFNILRNRIDRFGVAQPNIQKLTTSDRILIELPGIKDPERVRKLLQGTAKLEFWETYQFDQLAPFFNEANKKLASVDMTDSTKVTGDTTKVAVKDLTSAKTLPANKTPVKKTTAKADTAKKEPALLEKLADSTKAKGKEKQSFEKYAKENPLYAYLSPAFNRGENGQYYPSNKATVGYSAIKDTARVNFLLRKVMNIFPRNMR
ncbi:MAG TPA: protein translocase subunit SecDF, partial [Bacteroidales bacterium]